MPCTAADGVTCAPVIPSGVLSLDRALGCGELPTHRLQRSFSRAGPVGALLNGFLVDQVGPEMTLLICSAAMLTIIAMVSLPDFDPNNPASAFEPVDGKKDQRFNRITSGIFECRSGQKLNLTGGTATDLYLGCDADVAAAAVVTNLRGQGKHTATLLSNATGMTLAKLRDGFTLISKRSGLFDVGAGCTARLTDAAAAAKLVAMRVLVDGVPRKTLINVNVPAQRPRGLRVRGAGHEHDRGRERTQDIARLTINAIYLIIRGNVEIPVGTKVE